MRAMPMRACRRLVTVMTRTTPTMQGRVLASIHCAGDAMRSATSHSPCALSAARVHAALAALGVHAVPLHAAAMQAHAVAQASLVREQSCVQVPKSRPDASQAHPAMGISQLAFSASGRYLASLNDNQKSAAWVWDVQTLSLSCVLAHERPVQQLVWHPVEDKLAICTGSRRCAGACYLHAVICPSGAGCVLMKV
jgi:hypothetical protein